jgi:uracil-DNA glycosylase
MLSVSEEEFLKVIDSMCLCERCELSEYRTQVVPYRGDPRTDIMIIGEAPGYDEDQSGRAMVGRTGSYLVSLFSEYGIPVNKLYITNTVMCRPLNNADPMKNQLLACAGWLIKHIEMVNPKYIVAVGRFAVKRLLPECTGDQFKITQMEGNIYKSPSFNNRTVLPLRHPSAILRNPIGKEYYEKNVRKVVEYILKEQQL